LILNFVSELYVYDGVVDFRRSYDGLSGVVTNELCREPTDGSVYIFFNRKRDQIKLLYYEVSGYCLWQKRLSVGRFERVFSGRICTAELLMLLEGISLERGVKRKKRMK
jgi:transposase